MRVIVVGATGVVGHEVLASLAGDKSIDDVISLTETHSDCDHVACTELGIEHQSADLNEDLTTTLCYSDAVVYAGWPISDSHIGPPRSNYPNRLATLCRSVAQAGVRTFVVGSSALGYCGAPAAGRPVDEGWPLVQSSADSTVRLVVKAEDLVSEFATQHEIIRVVVLRPALIAFPTRPPVSWRERFSRRVVKGLLAGRLIRVVPDLGAGGIQMIHSADLAEAFRLALTESVVGRFNLAADPISADMLADAFKARVRVSPTGALKVHSYARRLGLARFDTSALRASWQNPTLDTGRASSELGWSPTHTASSILEEWASSVATAGQDDHGKQASLEVDRSADVEEKVDYRALYQRALDQFGQRVHAIRGDQWLAVTRCPEWNVWQLVGSVARQQYQTALRLRGEEEDVIKGRLPDDPLGFARADGWDLAAERGTLAINERPAGSVVDRVLPDVICDLTLNGWILAEATGFEGPGDAELDLFVEERVGTFNES